MMGAAMMNNREERIDIKHSKAQTDNRRGGICLFVVSVVSVVRLKMLNTA